MILTWGQQARPAGLSTLEQVLEAKAAAEGAAATAAADAFAAAQPQIAQAIADGAAGAAIAAAEAVAPAAADAIRAQVAADADRAVAAAGTLNPPGAPDTHLIGTGQWASRALYDMIGDSVVFAADWTAGGALVVGQGTMADAITVTRAAPGYYLDASGLYRSFASGEARVGDRGLLIEPERTNLFKGSMAPDGAEWTKVRMGVTAAVRTVAGLPAAHLVPTAEASTHSIWQSVPVTAGTAITVSAIAAAGEYGFLVLQAQGSPFSAQPRVAFDLVLGTATVIQGTATWRMTPLADGWLCEMTVTPGASGNGALYAFVAPTATIPYTANGTSGVYVAGLQAEAGTHATSIIATAAAAVTRPVDLVALRSGGAWWPSGQGTILVEAEAIHRPGACLIGSTSGASSPMVMTAAVREVGSRSGGAVLAAISGNRQWAIGQTMLALSAWSASGRSVQADGGQAVSDATPLPAATMSHVGSRGAAVPGEVMSGYVRKMIVWDRRLAA